MFTRTLTLTLALTLTLTLTLTKTLFLTLTLTCAWAPKQVGCPWGKCQLSGPQAGKFKLLSVTSC